MQGLLFDFRIVQIHDTIAELKNKPADDITSALLDR